MEIYATQNYKEFLRARQKELVREKPAFTWKKIAEQVPLQHTYLSRALHEPKSHLNEDHLFVIGRILGLSPTEIDFLLLQRSYELAQDADRRKFLLAKLARFRKDKPLKSAVQEHQESQRLEEAAYLFDPLCVLVHAAMHIPAVKREPRFICERLGISPAQLKTILRKLQRVGFVELSEDGARVKEVKQSNIHYGRDHQFMRLHQTVLKTLIHSQLNRTEEEDKHSFIVTFTMDQTGYDKVKDEFQAFLKKVEQVVGKCRDERLYQMSFDLFRWL